MLMMLRLISSTVLTLLAAHVLAQAPSSQPRSIDTLGLSSGLVWAESITADELRGYAFALASDSMQGRETGTDGQRLAGRYLAKEFSSFGLPRVGFDYSYMQPIAFESASWDRVRMSIDGKDSKHLKDFFAFPAESNTLVQSFDQVVYIGWGIDTEAYSDYRDAPDLEGKVLVALAGEPFGKNGQSLVTGSVDTSAWSKDLSLKRAAAMRKGAAMLLIVQPQIQAEITKARPRILENGLRLRSPNRLPEGTAVFNVLHISPGMFAELIKDKRKQAVKARKKALRKNGIQPVVAKTDLQVDLQPRQFSLSGENVLGYVRGNDPVLAEELVIVSAHYDHLGMRKESIFYGADDNASGTSTVLEIAEAMSMASKAGAGPKRSVLFLLVSGEEKGLLGSQYYAEHPVFPLEKTIANVNIDMIGRYDEAHADSSAYIYVIGAGRISPDLDATVQQINAASENVDLDYTFDAEDDPNRFYYRSDHYNFAKRGIPSVFFFSGVHEDYHRPGDTPDKLDYDKMERIGKMAFLITWNLANRPGELNRK